MSIPECQKKLLGAKHAGEPLPQGFLWLLATGEVRTFTLKNILEALSPLGAVVLGLLWVEGLMQYLNMYSVFFAKLWLLKRHFKFAISNVF